MNSWLMIPVIVILPAALLFGEIPSKEIDPETLRTWIRELNDDSFAVRQAATNQLAESGRAGIPLLRKAAQLDNLEVIERAVYVLFQLSNTGDAETKMSARRALADLASSKNGLTARRARAAIRLRQGQLVSELEQLGARVTVEGDKIVSISFSGSSVSDKDLWMLRELPVVRSLWLGGTKVGDAGMK